MALPSPSHASTNSLPLPDPEAYPGEPREYARALMQRKDDIEREIGVFEDILASHGTTASTSLIDPEGFPRADIDIYAIRHARSALARLSNDRQTVIDRLSIALQSAFSPIPSGSASGIRQVNGSKLPSGQVSPHRFPGRMDELPEVWPEGAIARVNSVAPASPAAEAGLKAGDMIHSFAGITAVDGGIQAIGTLVSRSEGTTLVLFVARGDEHVRLRLIPRSGWGGRGLLGCHILAA
ncbi:MAG: putative 26S proteasome regulatory subunit [Tremellales sp. Tagirdzhanova-0007]|nr:MAG: putative 26S proteasome regulatory subunit [Tremellales sp. Tagirdzhanova-0007]